MKNIPPHNFAACEKKKQYKDKKTAKRVAERVNAEKGERIIFAYRCPVCLRWHIGHGNRKAAIIKKETEMLTKVLTR